MKKFFILAMFCFGSYSLAENLPKCDDLTVLQNLKDTIKKDFKARCNPNDENDEYCLYEKGGSFSDFEIIETKAKETVCRVLFMLADEFEVLITYNSKSDKSISVQEYFVW